jgi:hypothetical protein
MASSPHETGVFNDWIMALAGRSETGIQLRNRLAGAHLWEIDPA